MKVCKISTKSIEELQLEWDNYYLRCIAAVNLQLENYLANVRSEAATDRYSERYTEDSVNAWLISAESEITAEANNLKSRIDNDYHSGLRLINEAAQLRFSEKNHGTLFRIDFYSESINAIPVPEEKTRFGVIFGGVSRDIGDEHIEFTAPDFYFSSWFDEEYDDENYR